MYELIYTSLAVTPITEEEVNKILSVAVKNNKQNDITGMLIYTNRAFVQMLEGEEATVKALYDKIYRDGRHENLRIFYEGYIQHRTFNGWSMASQSLQPAIEEHEEIGQLIGDKEPISLVQTKPNTGKRLFTMMSDLIGFKCA